MLTVYIGTTAYIEGLFYLLPNDQTVLKRNIDEDRKAPNMYLKKTPWRHCIFGISPNLRHSLNTASVVSWKPFLDLLYFISLVLLCSICTMKFDSVFTYSIHTHFKSLTLTFLFFHFFLLQNSKSMMITFMRIRIYLILFSPNRSRYRTFSPDS